ncbi:phospholipase D-like domain-containing protein [Yoonia sp. BS5-3]|uniref:Phospholipase D n=1 Tax=Yoonia phaeophyticola TaxID=3137369 RepID=A0ABZ2UZQ6_9RHOB
MVEILLTAEEAYPRFEELVAGAQTDVSISMRIFDAATPLYGSTGNGETWADLIAAKLAEGVRFDITLSDFDPVAKPELHRYAWECFERLKSAASACPARMQARVHLHPAQAGMLQRLLFAPAALFHIHKECERLNALAPDDRARQLEAMPEFAKLIRTGPQLSPRFWRFPPLHIASHHQKMAVIDGETLYIGGLDLNPRRFDTKTHDRPAPQTWHDVQVVCQGPIASAARTHINTFRSGAEGQDITAVPGLIRTLSQRRSFGVPRLSPKTVLNDIEQAHFDLIESARTFIYIETQFLRSSRIVTALCKAAHRGVSLIVILPAAPEEAAFGDASGLDTRFGEHLQARAIGRLKRAFGGNMFLGSPVQPKAQDGDRDTLEQAPIIYVHAKVIISDAERAIVSSANLNGRSMRWDTEAGVVLKDKDARRLFQRCTQHWLSDAAPDGLERAQTWRDLASKNAKTEPNERPHFLVPHNPVPGQDKGHDLPGIPEEMV